jgi:glycosyltransferase involved in cell wall biosynthesis
MKDKVLIIIPVFNEGKRIKKVISEVKKNNPRASICVINDGSNDETEEILRKQKIIYLSHPFNLGYGVALQTGYKFALSNYQKFDIIIQMDGDGQHNPQFIKDLIKNIKNDKIDMVIGSRFLSHDYKMSFSRKIGILIFRSLIKIFAGYKITDPTSGFRAMKKNLLKVFITDVYPTDFPDADLLITLISGGIRIKEVPVSMLPSPKEKKPMHNGLTVLYYVFKQFLSILIGFIRSKNLQVSS